MNEMIAMVQVYIHIITDKQIKINVVNGHDLLLLKQAHMIAMNFFQTNNVKVYA